MLGFPVAACRARLLVLGNSRFPTMPRQVKTLITLLRRLGILLTVMFMADSLLARLGKARILLIIVRERAQLLSENIRLPAGISAAVRTAEQMLTTGGYCGATLGPDFLSTAVQRGDRCVVILDQGEVVNFQWLASGLALAYDDICIGPGPRYLYGYNSVTAPSHRGRGLNRSAVLIAGQLVAGPEHKGLVGYINATNVASMLSQWDPAKQRFGFALVWPRAGKRLWVLASRAVRAGQVTFARL